MMDLLLPEVGGEVVWWALSAGRIQVLLGFLRLPDWACLLTACSSGESEKKKILLLENLELAIMSPYLKIPCMLLFFLNVSASV